MHVLGISCYFHDAAAALISDGQLVAAAEEERFTRKKHDYDFPARAIEFCLQRAGISAADLDHVVFFEKPFLKLERLMMSMMQTFPRSRRVFREAMLSWLGDKLWIKQRIEQHLQIPGTKVLFSEHHMSHAASAFFCSPFDDAAILTVDGVGEWATASIGVGRGTNISLLDEIRFPHSLGLLYSAFTAFLGFEVNEGEYKVMGMAPFGQPRHVDDVHRLIHVRDDGSFELDMDYFSFHHSSDTAFNGKFSALFGAPRDPRANFFTESSGYPSYFGAKPANFLELARENQRYADIAASIQHVTEETLLKMARHAHQRTGARRLCLAGGVALNSVASGRLLREGPFDEIYVQPAAGDGGAALGAALYGYHMALGQPRGLVLDHAYWGAEHSEAQTADFLRQANIAHQHFSDESKLIDYVTDRLSQGKVVGWSQGRFEWGPRALGNRSILADPRRAEMKDIVNTKIKFREPYRPFAPSVLVQHAEEFFALPRAAQQYPARFMLFVVDVLPDQRERIPAVTHVDGTARPQTVSRSTNPRFYDLIERFGQSTGIPVLMNTSFNLKGEPIVNTPREAFRTFSVSEMDVLVLNQFVVDRS